MLELIGRAHAAVGNATFTWPTLHAIDLGNTSPADKFTGILTTAMNWILFIAGAIAVIYLIYGGLMYITAGGDAEKATKGRTAIVNAIIGIVIIALAFVIVGLVTTIFK